MYIVVKYLWKKVVSVATYLVDIITLVNLIQRISLEDSRRFNPGLVGNFWNTYYKISLGIV